MNNYKMLLLNTLTPTHVGSGDTHFSFVDNLIQRDPITLLPIIHSSGIKGALRDYFEIETENKKLSTEEIIKIFGTESGKSDETDKEQANTGEIKFDPGHAIFFEARLLLLPLRATQNVFYYGTSVNTVSEYLEYLESFRIVSAEELTSIKSLLHQIEENLITKEFLVFENNPDLEIEDYKDFSVYTTIVDEIKKKLEKLLQVNLNSVAFFNPEVFQNICESSIPVIARNQLDDKGISKNLFYEEALPRKSKLYFLLGDDSLLKELFGKLVTSITLQSPTIQFGGNYSVGYGFSTIQELSLR